MWKITIRDFTLEKILIMVAMNPWRGLQQAIALRYVG